MHVKPSRECAVTRAFLLRDSQSVTKASAKNGNPASAQMTVFSLMSTLYAISLSFLRNSTHLGMTKSGTVLYLAKSRLNM